MSIRQREWRLMAAILLLLAVFAAKGLLLQPPSPPARPAADAFDTQRALARLTRILGDQRPHPVDTPANDAVRERLIAEIAAIGLKSEVHEAMDCSGYPKSRTVSCSHVRNVVAVIPGPQAPALLLNVHYDSTPTGPGAADDGIGVATILEVAQHLRRQRLARPVILLFNEGEEYGLNGAAAFVDSDPLARRVGKLINIEARGVRGPAFMFETNEPNGPAIADFRAASARPFANSISTDFARLIPNSTDVVMFKPKQWQTLSFAIIGNETRYHSPGDRIEALDRASLYHMGSEVLAASRRMAGPDTGPPSGRMLFTDVGGLGLITMPFLAGALLLGGLAIGAGVLVARRRAWRPLLGLTIALVGGIAAAAAIATLAGFLRAGDFWRAYPWVTTLAVAATVLPVEGWLVARSAARHDRSQLRLAAWAGAIVQLLLFTELIAQIELTLIDGPLWAIAPLVALAALPILADTARDASRWTFTAAALLPIGLWIAALLVPRASAERPLAFTLDHVQDERTGKALWAAATKQAPLSQGFSKFGPWRAGALPYNKRIRWLAAAPPIEASAAKVTVLDSAATPKGRRVRLRFEPGDADGVLLRFDEAVPVAAMGLPGKLRELGREAPPGPSILRCAGRHCDGLEVEVVIGSRKPITAMLVAQRFTPPPQAAPLLALRPANAHPQYSPDSQVRISAVKL